MAIRSGNLRVVSGKSTHSYRQKFAYDVSLAPRVRPMINAPRNSTTNIPNSHCAMVAEAASTSLKPKTPAITAMTRKIKAHFSIGDAPLNQFRPDKMSRKHHEVPEATVALFRVCAG